MSLELWVRNGEGQREAQETQIRGIQNPRLGLSRDPVCPSRSSLVVQARLFDENEQELERFDSIRSKVPTSQTHVKSEAW